MSDNKPLLDYLKQYLNTANKKGTFELDESFIIFNALEIVNLVLNEKEMNKEKINKEKINNAINILEKALNKANLNGCYNLNDAAKILLSLQKIVSLINELLSKKEQKSDHVNEKMNNTDDDNDENDDNDDNNDKN